MGHYRKKQVTVYPTNKCNLRCKYCVADSARVQMNAKSIDIEFAKTGIKDFFEEYDSKEIRFYSSGEPTQAMDIIKECVAYGRELIGDDLKTEIQTNGYLDKENVKWISKNIDYVWVSLDAWPEISNQYRPAVGNPTPGDTVVENIKKMQKETFVGVRATVVPETLERQVELVEYFHSIGVDHLYAEPVIEPARSDGVMQSKEKILWVDGMKYARNFVKGHKKAQELGTFYGNNFMVNFDEDVKICCRSCIPAPHLTTDGYVSACDLGLYGNTPLTDLIYGKWDKENKKIIYYPEKIDKLRSRNTEVMGQKGCKDCKILERCAGGCFGRAYHETNDFYGIMPDWCEITKYLWKEIGETKIDYLHP